MKIEETEDASLEFNNPLSKGIVIFPEDKKELDVINYVLNHKKIELQNFIKNSRKL